VHALSEGKSDDSKDGFYKELEQVFNRSPLMSYIYRAPSKARNANIYIYIYI